MLLQELGEIQGEQHAVDGEGPCQTHTWYEGHPQHPAEGPHLMMMMLMMVQLLCLYDLPSRRYEKNKT